MSMTMHHNDDGSVESHDVDKNGIGIEIEIENNAGMDDSVLRPFVLPTLGEGISTMTATALGLECTDHPTLLEDWATTEWMSIVHEASTFSPNTSTSNSKERQGDVVASTEGEETVVGADTGADVNDYLCVKDLTSFFVHNNNNTNNNDDDSNSNSSDISRPLPAATTVTVTGDKDPEEDVSTASATRATSSGAAMQRRGNEYESMTTTTADHHEFDNFQHQFSSNNLTNFGCPDVNASSAEHRHRGHHITSNDVEALPMFLPSPTSSAAIILRSSNSTGYNDEAAQTATTIPVHVPILSSPGGLLFLGDNSTRPPTSSSSSRTIGNTFTSMSVDTSARSLALEEPTFGFQQFDDLLNDDAHAQVRHGVGRDDNELQMDLGALPLSLPFDLSNPMPRRQSSVHQDDSNLRIDRRNVDMGDVGLTRMMRASTTTSMLMRMTPPPTGAEEGSATKSSPESNLDCSRSDPREHVEAFLHSHTLFSSEHDLMDHPSASSLQLSSVSHMFPTAGPGSSACTPPPSAIHSPIPTSVPPSYSSSNGEEEGMTMMSGFTTPPIMPLSDIGGARRQDDGNDDDEQELLTPIERLASIVGMERKRKRKNESGQYEPGQNHHHPHQVLSLVIPSELHSRAEPDPSDPVLLRCSPLSRIQDLPRPHGSDEYTNHSSSRNNNMRSLRMRVFAFADRAGEAVSSITPTTATSSQTESEVETYFESGIGVVIASPPRRSITGFPREESWHAADGRRGFLGGSRFPVSICDDDGYQREQQQEQEQHAVDVEHQPIGMEKMTTPRPSLSPVDVDCEDVMGVVEDELCCGDSAGVNDTRQAQIDTGVDINVVDDENSNNLLTTACSGMIWNGTTMMTKAATRSSQSSLCQMPLSPVSPGIACAEPKKKKNGVNTMTRHDKLEDDLLGSSPMTHDVNTLTPSPPTPTSPSSTSLAILFTTAPSTFSPSRKRNQPSCAHSTGASSSPPPTTTLSHQTPSNPLGELDQRGQQHSHQSDSTTALASSSSPPPSGPVELPHSHSPSHSQLDRSEDQKEEESRSRSSSSSETIYSISPQSHPRALPHSLLENFDAEGEVHHTDIMAPSSSGDIISPFHPDGDDRYDVENVETEVLTSSPSDDKKLKSFGRLPSSVGSDEDIVNDKQPSQSSLSPSGKATTPEVKPSSSPSTFISSSSVLPSTSLPLTSSSSALLDRPQSTRASPGISEVVSANVVVAAARKRRRLENPISTTALPIAISSGGDGGITSATGSAGVRVTRSSTRRRRPRGSGRQVSDLSDDDNSGGERGDNYSDIEEKRDPSSISRSGILTRSGSSTGTRAARQTRSGLRSSSISPTLELINSRNRTGTNTPTPSPSSGRTTRASATPSTLREPSMRNSRRTVTRSSPIAQTGRTTRRSSGGITTTADLTGTEPPAVSPPGSARGGGGQQLVSSASMISGQSHHHRLPSDSNGSQTNSHGAYYHQSQQRREYASPSSSYTGGRAPAEYSSSYPPPAFDSTSSSARNDEGLSYSSSGLGSRSLRQRRRGDEYEGGDAGAIPYDDEGEDMERRRASSGSEYEEDVEMRDAYTDSREGGDRHGHHQRLQSSRSSRGVIISSSDSQGGGGGRWAEQPSLTQVRSRHGAPIASYAPSASEYTLPPPRPSALSYGSPPASSSGSGMMAGDQTGVPLLPSPHQLAQSSSPPHHHHVQQHPTPSASGTKKRGNLPREVTELLKSWILSHAENPYPTDEEKRWLCAQTGLTYVQVSNWMINARRRVLPPENKHKYQRPSAAAPPRSSTNTGIFPSSSSYGGGSGSYSSSAAGPSSSSSFVTGPPSFGVGVGGRHTSSSSSHHLSPLELPAPGSLDPLPQLDPVPRSSASASGGSNSMALSPLQWTSPRHNTDSSSSPRSRQGSHSSTSPGMYWAPSMRSGGAGRTFSPPPYTSTRSRTPGPSQDATTAPATTSSSGRSRGRGGVLSIEELAAYGYTPAQAAYVASTTASRDRDRDRDRGGEKEFDRNKSPPPPPPRY